MSGFDEQVIAEFRANGGRVDSAGFGSNLVLLHTIGARTGAERVNPAMSLRDGDAWLVVASAAGAPRDPAWAFNLRAHPDVDIEVAGPDGVEVVPVTAEELDGQAYTTAFARFARRSSAFVAYQARATGRRLPVIRLTRRAALDDGRERPAARGAVSPSGPSPAP